MNTRSDMVNSAVTFVTVILLALTIGVCLVPGGILRRHVDIWWLGIEQRRVIAKEWTDITTGPRLGNVEGEVATVVFFDYTCPYCRLTGDTIAAFFSSHPNEAIVVRQLPNPGSALARSASMLAICASLQQRFATAHDYLAGQDDWIEDNLEATDWVLVGKRAGLEEGRLRDCLQSNRAEAALESDAELARRLSIRFTPAFLEPESGVYRGMPTVGKMSEWSGADW